MKIGIIGCGIISGAYLKGMALHKDCEVVACADLSEEAAQSRAKEFSIPRVMGTEELINDPEVELILNLTHPQVHAAINLKILEAGKHAYCEKPFCFDLEEGRKVLDMAEQKGLQVACAPDTVLGNGIQGARHAIESGLIGEPLAAQAFLVGRGPEHWHNNPEFYYKVGGGPLWDMGPYYLNSLIQLIGEFDDVCGRTKISFSQREILSERFRGKMIDVETPTHLTGVIGMKSGVLATITFSFDVFGGHQLPKFEIYGTQGTLQVPDPNRFDGQILYKLRDTEEWVEYENPFQNNEMRGLGVAEMIRAAQEGRPCRAHGKYAFHVAELITRFHESEISGRREKITSSVNQPLAMPTLL